MDLVTAVLWMKVTTEFIYFLPTQYISRVKNSENDSRELELRNYAIASLCTFAT